MILSLPARGPQFEGSGGAVKSGVGGRVAEAPEALREERPCRSTCRRCPGVEPCRSPVLAPDLGIVQRLRCAGPGTAGGCSVTRPDREFLVPNSDIRFRKRIFLTGPSPEASRVDYLNLQPLRHPAEFRLAAAFALTRKIHAGPDGPPADSHASSYNIAAPPERRADRRRSGSVRQTVTARRFLGRREPGGNRMHRTVSYDTVSPIALRRAHRQKSFRHRRPLSEPASKGDILTSRRGGVSNLRQYASYCPCKRLSLEAG